MKRTLSILALAAFGLTAPVHAAGMNDQPADAMAPKGSEHAAQKLTFTNQMVGGKKTWVPSDTNEKVKAGKSLEIQLVNTLPEKEGHGFSAPGLLSEPVVVLPGQTKTVKVEAPKAGTYKFFCQLHPKHVGGVIDVTP